MFFLRRGCVHFPTYCLELFRKPRPSVKPKPAGCKYFVPLVASVQDAGCAALVRLNLFVLQTNVAPFSQWRRPNQSGDLRNDVAVFRHSAFAEQRIASEHKQHRKYDCHIGRRAKQIESNCLIRKQGGAKPFGCWKSRALSQPETPSQGSEDKCQTS
jgi:hypothetical protein